MPSASVPASASLPDELLTVSIPCSTKDVDAIDAWLGGNKPTAGNGSTRKPGKRDMTSDYDWHTPDVEAAAIRPRSRQAKASEDASHIQRHQHPEGKLATSSLSEEGGSEQTNEDTGTTGGSTGDMSVEKGTEASENKVGTPSEGNGASEEKKESILSGISMSQVTAGALAAVTSLLLSSQIGIAGSVIGVAIASVISTVSGQVYKVMLSRSADKLKAMAQAAPINVPIIGTAKEGEGSGNVDGTSNIDATMTRSEIPEELAFHDGVTERVPRVGGASKNITGKGSEGAFKTQPVGGIGNWDVGQDGMRVAPKALRVAAAEREREDMKRKVIIFTVIASLAAVLLTAGIITLVTNGNGIGEKTPSIVQTVTGSGTASRNADDTDGIFTSANANFGMTGNLNTDTEANENAETDGYGKYGYGNGHSRNQNANVNDTTKSSDSDSEKVSGETSSTWDEDSDDDGGSDTKGSQGSNTSGTSSNGSNGSTGSGTTSNKNNGNGSGSSTGSSKNETSNGTSAGGNSSSNTSAGSGTDTGNGITGTTDTTGTGAE